MYPKGDRGMAEETSDQERAERWPIKATWWGAMLAGVFMGGVIQAVDDDGPFGWVLLPIGFLLFFLMVAGISYFKEFQKVNRERTQELFWSWSDEAMRRFYLPAWIRVGFFGVGILGTLIVPIVLGKS